MSQFSGRGFGPGLPASGASVTARRVGHELWIEDWPEQTAVNQSQIRARRQGEGVLLEWDTALGVCALSLPVSAEPLLRDWLVLKKPVADRATRRWLHAVLWVSLGLPLLLVALLVVFRSELLDAATEQLPIEQEQAWAKQLWEMQRAELDLIESGPAYDAVQQLGARLVAAQPVRYTYQFYLARDNEVNAYALPAGMIVVNHALIQKADSAEELAGVMAHEIAHVELRHGVRGIMQRLGISAGWGILTGEWTGAMVPELLALAYSREQESAADAAGFSRLLAAKIDPHGLAQFFQKLDAGGMAIPALISTHPESAHRAREVLARLNQTEVLPPLPIDWAAVKASLGNAE